MSDERPREVPPWITARAPVAPEDRNVVRSDDLDGKVALITGGGNGIGAGVARRLASGGALVVVADVDVDAGEAVAKELGGVFVRCDVRRQEDLEAAVARAEDAGGGLDVVHLNAGISSGTRVDEFDASAYRRMMGINVDGVILGAMAAVPALHRRRGGAIIATASMAGLFPLAGEPFYSASKHAVVGFCRSLGQQLYRYGIWVNAVCPGFTDTKILGVGRELLESAGVSVMTVDDVVEGFIAALDSPRSGECFAVVHGRSPQAFEFATGRTSEERD